MASNINIKNKKAYFDYELIERFKAGIQLTGTEIKSIRDGKANLVDAFCFFINNELWLKGLRINEYTHGSYNNHNPHRDKKLLLQRKELNKLDRRVKEKGLTLVALKLFIDEKGLAKVNIALGKGKREFDKRESIKKKDSQRELDRIKKSNY